MDAKQIKQLKPMLEKYLREFDDCFGRSEPSRHLRTYVTGQFSDLQRKSMEPMADAAGRRPRNLQHFLALHSWDEMRMRDTLQQMVARDHQHPCSIGIIDETGHPKKGDKTPGVQRQWCGATGKVDNCTVTVHLGYAAGDFHCLLDGELFLPESWSADRERCRAAGIPDDMTHRPKWQIALEILDRTVANGVRCEWVGFDEGYSVNPEFLFALDDRGQRYVGEIRRTFTGWLTKPALLYKKHHHKPGNPGKFPRLQVKNAQPANVENLLKYSPILRKIPWEKFYVKDTNKGPMVWEAKAAMIYLKRDGLPTRPHWLIIARNAEDPNQIKFFISNAPEGTPLEVLLHVGFSRWHVERCFQDEKSELGLSHFEVRNYQSLRRHLILTAVSHLFLAKVHQRWWGEKSGLDGLPTSHCLLGPGPISLADGPSARKVPDTSSNHYYPYAGTTGRISPQPRQEKAEALA